MSVAGAVVAGGGLEQVSEEQWRELGSRRVFFGHQSVGDNVLDGVAAVLADRPELPLRVMGVPSGGEVGPEPGLYHAKVGRNGDPESKLVEFARLVRGATGAGPVVALVKFCYVDVGPGTDGAALFETYRKSVEALRESHAMLTMVHVTLPLMGDRGALFHLRTLVRGNGARSDRRLNHERHRFNERLRETYGGRDAIFDLALAESTRTDGSAVTVRYAGTDVPILAHEWSLDGGHLNAAGSRRAAEALLVTLASL